VKKILRVAQFVLLALVLLYAGDYVAARFRLPNNRQTLGSVDVQVMWAIKQKNGRIDYELGDTETQPCLRSLFPHLGYTPCWYLTRHRNQVIQVGGIRRPRQPERATWFAASNTGPSRLPRLRGKTRRLLSTAQPALEVVLRVFVVNYCSTTETNHQIFAGRDDSGPLYPPRGWRAQSQ